MTDGEWLPYLSPYGIESVLKKYNLNVLTNWGGPDIPAPDPPAFHLSDGNCNDFGCTEACASGSTLQEAIENWARKKHLGWEELIAL